MMHVKHTRTACQMAEELREQAIPMVAAMLFVGNSILPSRHHGKRKFNVTGFRGANLDAIVRKLDREEGKITQRQDRQNDKDAKAARVEQYAKDAAEFSNWNADAECDASPLGYNTNDYRLHRAQMAFCEAMGLVTEEEYKKARDEAVNED